MKVYTRGGDSGETSLFGGQRVPKDDARIESVGSVDELNAVLGVARAALDDDALDSELAAIQATLFEIGAALARPKRSKDQGGIAESEVAALERCIDLLDEQIEPLRSFILPGGAPGAAQLHHARTVCRRAERRVVSLAAHAQADVDPVLIRYLNRLSDLLFTMARAVNQREGVAEPTWSGRDA